MLKKLPCRYVYSDGDKRGMLPVELIEQNRRRSRATPTLLRLKFGSGWPEDEMRNRQVIFGQPLRSEDMQIKDKSSDSHTADGRVPPMPPVNFSTFVLSLNSSALAHLGELPMPGEKSTDIDLNLARHTIDVLVMLEEKTRGNLSDDEEKLLKHVLYDLRMKFIAASK